MQISISRVKLFKGCRRAYELKYVENLVPVATPEALEVGRNYHKMLENIYNDVPQETDYSKEAAMVEAYLKYIYPNFKVKAAEEKLTYDLGNGDELIGFADGLTPDGELVEHKTTGQEITEAYEYDLQWDEQILAYMLMTGARKVWYTVCRKPTIRLKQNETEEEFFNRMCEWYDTDTEKKIRLLEITRTDAEVEQFKIDLLGMLSEMKRAGEEKIFYKNQGWCFKWGRRCEYAPVCLNYDPEQEYMEFTKQEVEQ